MRGGINWTLNVNYIGPELRREVSGHCEFGAILQRWKISSDGRCKDCGYLEFQVLNAVYNDLIPLTLSWVLQDFAFCMPRRTQTGWTSETEFPLPTHNLYIFRILIAPKCLCASFRSNRRNDSVEHLPRTGRIEKVNSGKRILRGIRSSDIRKCRVLPPSSWKHQKHQP